MSALNKARFIEELEELGSFDQLIEDHFGQNRKLFILCDENTQEYCLPLLDNTFGGKLAQAELILVEAGETSKSIEVYEGICETLLDLGADRSAILINLGGGVVTDLGAFVASTFKRGIDFINIPTSLLAMVDAAWGGKNGINLGVHKNQIGTFNRPKLSILCPVFLTSLAEEELLNGKIEMLKHGLIANKEHWEAIEKDGIPDLKQIKESLSIKLEVCEKDPLEKGQRKQLNFGHTIGHAIESLFTEKGIPIAHGRAVAAGMICESFLSKKPGLNEQNLEMICTKLMSFHQKLNFSSSDFDKLIHFMQSDKKKQGKAMNLTLISDVGRAVIDQNPNDHELKASLQYYQKLKF